MAVSNKSIKMALWFMIAASASFVLMLCSVYSGMLDKADIVKMYQYPSDVLHRKFDFAFPVDIHLDNIFGHHFGHIWNHVISSSDEQNLSAAGDARRIITIGIGCALTFKRIRISELNENTIVAKAPFYNQMLTSFCKTASPGYSYHIYVTYDKNDPFLSKGPANLKLFSQTFHRIVTSVCANNSVNDVRLHLVQCSHVGYPAWAQNDAMMEAYMDGMDYLHRINDDTIYITTNWTSALIEYLARYDPPNVGVVGPNNHGGSRAVLTYDFVHRTHVDVFGYYYPRRFTDWYADNWITDVYKPGRSKKVKHIHLRHTLAMGQRYSYRGHGREKLKLEISLTKPVLMRYLAHKTGNISEVIPPGSYVIAMAAVADDIDCMVGVLRNAYLIRLLLPGWKLRIYTTSVNHNISGFESSHERFIRHYKKLAVQIFYVHDNSEESVWPLHIVTDMSVDIFEIRSCYQRITERDALVVTEMLHASGKAVHSIRDHPKYSSLGVSHEVWGGRPALLQKHVISFINDLKNITKTEQLPLLFNNTLWPAVDKIKGALCHDSVSCDLGPDTKPILHTRYNKEFIGQRFSQYHVPVSIEPKDKDLNEFPENLLSINCTDILIN